jgi:hypothetical protein
MLPVVFPQGTQKDVLYRLERTDELWEDIKSRARGGKAFHAYRHRDRIYVWAHSGQQMPDDLDLSKAVELLPSGDLVPSAVVAYAVREAVVDRLIDHLGFERVGATVEGQVRLFRRRVNLAAQALAPLADAAGKEIGPETGTFPYLAVQAMPLGDRDRSGPVALVLDAGVVNRLDIPLADLAQAGIDLNGMPVVWSHADECRCGFPDARGSAGKITGGDAATAVTVSISGQTRKVVSECLAPRVGRHDLDRYFGDYLNDDKRVESLIAAKLETMHDPQTQWKMLEETRKSISPLTIFTATEISLGAPVGADATGSSGVTLLSPVPAMKFNVRYAAPKLFDNPAIGINREGPYDSGSATRVARVKAVILHPRKFKADAERLRAALVTGLPGSYGFPGFKKTYELEEFTVELREFRGGTWEDYAKAAHEVTRPGPDGSTPHVCFTITQKSDQNAPRDKNPYLAAKAPVVIAGMASQGVTVEVLRQDDNSFNWVIQSIALQVYAKLGNIPFVLHDPDGTAELVIGIGRHDIHLPGLGFEKQIFGAAAAFRQDGDFLFAGSTAPVSDRNTYEDMLATLIGEFIEKFEREQGTELKRLILHVFKKTGPKEANAVERALKGRNIPFALVHVNRHTPLWMVTGPDERISPAEAGTVVALTDDDHLLMTGGAATGKRRNPHPLRLTLDRKSTFRDMTRISTQIRGFTGTSWRGFKTTHEPSTILYGRLLAEKVSQLLPYNFDPKRSTAIGDKPWFL